MQCPSCQFENMPGLTVCGRCGAQLALRASTVEVHPPRATDRAKRLRRWFPFYRVTAALSSALSSAVRNVPTWPTLEFDWPVLIRVCSRMVVPGWPQSYLGHRLRGRFFFWPYVLLLGLTALSIGTTFGATCLGFAIAIHLSSIIDVVWGAVAAQRERVVLTLACAMAVAVLLYVPFAAGVSRFVMVRQVQQNMGAFAPGDVLVIYRSETPQVGDVVLFNLPDYRVDIAMQGRDAHVVYDLHGAPFVDRIVAGPGQHIVWKNRTLLVDGLPSPWQPLRPEALTSDLDFVVPDYCFGILPGVETRGYWFSPGNWVAISSVPRRTILGRAVLLHRPYWRWSLL